MAPPLSGLPRYPQPDRQRLSGVLVGILLMAGCVRAPAPAPAGERATLTYDIHGAANPDASLDLDTGAVVDSADADIALAVQGGTDLFSVLIPVNGAKKVQIADKEDASLSDCRQALDRLSTTSIPDFVPGTHLCILTNRDQLALLTIVDVGGSAPGAASVQIDFITGPAR